MLRSLTIKNFAIIEEQTLDPGAGLNALTGETGAGKSILVEALGFLLGARGSASWLRAGAAKLEVAGLFDREDFPQDVRAQLKIADSPVMVRRELDASGKTRAIINAQSVPLAVLSSLGHALVDFHGQHEHQTLLRPLVQLELLDRFGGLEEESAKVGAAYQAWADARARLDSAQMSDDELRKRVELLRFQLEELGQADLKPGEEEQIEAALPLLKNAERLRGLAAGAYELLYEREGSIAALLLKAERALAELAKIDPQAKPQHDALEAARLSLDDAARAVGDYRDRAEADPGRLDSLLTRLETISRMKKRYGPTEADAISARHRVADELARLENSEALQRELEDALACATRLLDAACEAIHAARRKAASRLEAALVKELRLLGMPRAEFSVSVEMEEGRYAPTGADEAEFMLAPNPGEAVKPLKDTASGGELSRVMLALKTVLAKADRVPILVFDEVDAGIGGVVARAVGEKLAALGRTHQVLCITHLAQVAAFADSQFTVAKEVASGRTRVAVERVDGARRVEALAQMLAGRQATEAGRQHARELLDSSRTEAAAVKDARVARKAVARP